VIKHIFLRMAPNENRSRVMSSKDRLGMTNVMINMSSGMGGNLETKTNINFDHLDLGNLVPTNEIVTFVGDVSAGEREVMFSLWKLLNKWIGSPEIIRCLKCSKAFSEQWQLSQHLSTVCTGFLEEFFIQAQEYFSSKMSTFSLNFNVMNAFNFAKEKVLAFLGHKWCLLCGKTIPQTLSTSSKDSSFLLDHIIKTHLKKELSVLCQPEKGVSILKCRLPNKINKNYKCGSKFKSKDLLNSHIGVQHSMVDLLLIATEDVSTLDGTKPNTEKTFRNKSSSSIKCKSCGKEFTNKISLKIHTAIERKEGAPLGNDSRGFKCDNKNCSHTARFSQEEIVRHFGLCHLDLNQFQKKPQNSLEKSQNKQQKSIEEDDIIEVPVPKKVYEIIDIEDDETDQQIIQSKLPGNSPSSPHLSSSSMTLAPSSPLNCPSCNTSFPTSPLLHQHLSTQHFHQHLWSLVIPLNCQFWCPEAGCSFFHRNRQIVVRHVASTHTIAFNIAKKIFPEFKAPASDITSSPQSSPTLSTTQITKGTKRNSDGFATDNEAKRKSPH